MSWANYQPQLRQGNIRMKKTLISLTLVVMIFYLSFINFVEPSTTYVNDGMKLQSVAKAVSQDGVVIRITIGSNIMQVNSYSVDMVEAPEISNETTFIPITAIVKGFNASIEWVQDTKGLIITKGAKSVGIVVGSNTAVFNGNVVTVAAPYFKNGIVMLPVGVIFDGLGIGAEWDPVTGTFIFTEPATIFDSNSRWIVIRSSENGNVKPSIITRVSNGSSVTLTITADENCRVKDILVDDKSLGISQTTFTFENVTKDHVFQTIFEKAIFSIAASSSSGGTIVPSGKISVNSGNSKTFTITPENGYRIQDVKIDGASVGAVLTYTFDKVNDDHTIEAIFEPITTNKYTNIVLTIGNNTAIVNNLSVNLDVPAMIIESRTYVPLRFVAESMGAEVKWDEFDRKVTIRTFKITIELWIGKSTAIVNGKSVPIDSENLKVQPLIRNGRTLVPIRFVSEQLGLNVSYNSANKIVVISTHPILFNDLNSISYAEKNISYNGKNYNFKVVRIDPKANGIKIVPCLSVNGLNKGSDYKTFLLPNTIAMVNGIPFNTDTFVVSGTIFGNGSGIIEAGTIETIGIDAHGSLFYEEGRIELNAKVEMSDNTSEVLTTYSINNTTYGGFTVYTNWYNQDIDVWLSEIFIIIENGKVINKLSAKTVNPSKILKGKQFGIYAYHGVRDTVEIFSKATSVEIKLSINGRDITNSFFVQSCPVVIRDGMPFKGADRYPDSYRMTKSGARVFMAIDGRYIYFIVTPTAMSLRGEPAGEIISKLGFFTYVVSLDGGGSTAFYYKDRFIYTPSRNLVTCIVVVSEKP